MEEEEIDISELISYPIEIVSGQIILNEMMHAVVIEYKNISDKAITGAKFYVELLDAFNEPANVFIIKDGVIHCVDSEGCSQGQNRSIYTRLYASNAKTIVQLLPFKVMFADGTVWKIKIPNEFYYQ